MSGLRLFPDAASEFAGKVDLLFWSLVAFSAALGLFLTFLVLYYAVRYRAGSTAGRAGARSRNPHLEVAWITGTLTLAIVLFGWGAGLFMDEAKMPDDALRISGIGKQWMWKFQHPGGQREINALHVPVGEPVVLDLGSQDVIHSFFVPAFRVKKDAVPGRTTFVSFTASRTGRFRLFCAEYCGTRHSGMTGWIYAVSPEDYAAWLDAQGAQMSLAEQGERLFRSLGCSGCHGASSAVRAPDLTGIWDRPVATETGVVTADTAYLRDSILRPEARIVAGYPPVMPSFDGLIDEGELQLLIAYIQSLKGAPE
jgi:cytochrome c oxidase subunit 2